MLVLIGVPFTRENTVASIDWTDEDWNTLLREIKLKECTPFIGSGASAHILLTGRQLAELWAKQSKYPFPDSNNLLKVAQYVAIQEGGRAPQLKIVEQFNGGKTPNFAERDEPHRVMAQLRLPLYITTNYDAFMIRALQTVHPPERVRREYCRWHEAGGTKKPERVKWKEATEDSPVVYHLHGILDVPDSIVITEDHYLDFLMYLSEDPRLIPAQVERVFKNSSLLFLGYSLDDTDFKLILRRMASYLHRSEGPRHVAVQIKPRLGGDSPTKEDLEQAELQQDYMYKHYNLQKVKVYWGSCQKFAGELADRWLLK
jgi:hypothetical protein